MVEARRQPPRRVYREHPPPGVQRTGPKKLYRLDNLQELRLERNLRQSDLAELAGITRAALSRLEWCQTRAKMETLIGLAEALEIDPVELIRPGKARNDTET